eukprot:363494-Chlamydomonas_euryale.AAC.7
MPHISHAPCMRCMQAYKYSGDVYAIHPGDKPWISEMYGYSYGAAKADVWHKWDTHSMIYPQYIPSGGYAMQGSKWGHRSRWRGKGGKGQGANASARIITLGFVCHSEIDPSMGRRHW